METKLIIVESLSIVKLVDRPELADRMTAVGEEAYPPYFAGQSNYYDAMDRLGDTVRNLKLAVVDGGNRVVAGAEAVPLTWDGTDENLPGGYDAALQMAVSVRESGTQPDTLCLVNLMVSEAARGRRLTVKLAQEFWDIDVGFEPRAIICNVRGALKHEHPNTPLTEYIGWTNDDGKVYDPWLRSFLDAGARLGPVVDETLTISSSLADWTKWTGMEFPRSGEYIIPMGLAPLVADCEQDEGRYVEPGVWIIMERNSSSSPGS